MWVFECESLVRTSLNETDFLKLTYLGDCCLKEAELCVDISDTQCAAQLLGLRIGAKVYYYSTTMLFFLPPNALWISIPNTPHHKHYPYLLPVGEMYNSR